MDKTQRTSREQNTPGKYGEGTVYICTSRGFLRTRQRGSLIENRNALLEGRFRGRFAGVANSAHTVLHCLPAVLKGSPVGPTPGPVNLRVG